jgi:RNA polymerase sigma-70 factor (ECF subfamily)
VIRKHFRPWSRSFIANSIVWDDALNDLSRLDERQGRIVELRFFGGLSIEETGGVLGVSPATAKREWATARAFLSNELGRSPRR